MRVSHWRTVFALLAIATGPFFCDALRPRKARLAAVELHSVPSSSRGAVGAPATEADVPVSDIVLADGTAAGDATGDVDVDKVLAEAGAAESGATDDGLVSADEALASDTEDQASVDEEAAKKAKEAAKQEALAKEQKSKKARAAAKKAKAKAKAKADVAKAKLAKKKIAVRPPQAKDAIARHEETHVAVTPAPAAVVPPTVVSAVKPATKAASKPTPKMTSVKKGRHSLAAVSTRGGVRHKNLRRGHVNASVNSDTDDADDEKDDDKDDSKDDADRKDTESEKDDGADVEASAANHAAATKAKKEENEEKEDKEDRADELKLEASIEGKFMEEISQDEDMLRKNLEKQADIKSSLNELSQDRNDEDIDEAVQPIVNETHSPAIALVLSRMWKEMRTYERPVFQKHLMEDLAPLETHEHVLEAALNATEANLTLAKAEFAKEESDENDAESDDVDEDGVDKDNATALAAPKDGSANAVALHAQVAEQEVQFAAPSEGKKAVVHSGASVRLGFYTKFCCLILVVVSCYF